jgi:hypothetical protein
MFPPTKQVSQTPPKRKAAPSEADQPVKKLKVPSEAVAVLPTNSPSKTEVAKPPVVERNSKVESQSKVEEEKPSKPEVDISKIDFKALLQAGSLNKLSVPQMKSFLKTKGLKLGGKKEDLVQRITEFCKKET